MTSWLEDDGSQRPRSQADTLWSETFASSASSPRLRPQNSRNLRIRSDKGMDPCLHARSQKVKECFSQPKEPLASCGGRIKGSLSRPDLSDFPPGFEFPIEDALEEIERALDTLGWSRAELSRRATEKKGEKVSAQTVSNVLNRTYPRSKDLPFMLEALGLPFELAIPGLTTTQRRAAIKLRELGPEAAEAYLTVLLGLKGR